MRLRGACVALCLWAGPALAGGAATEKSAPSSLRSSRETPTVRAVPKVLEGVVALKVTKPGTSKDSVGTGVIIDEAGYIVTNGHVIRIRMGDYEVTNRFDVERALWQRREGDKVDVTLLRGGKTLHVPLTLVKAASTRN